MSDLGIYLFDSPGGRLMLADWTYVAQRPTIETNERGYKSWSAFIPMPLHDAFRFYDLPPTLHLRIRDGSEVAFAGRLEDRAIVDGGLRVTALGYQRAFSDVLYTALWSDTHFDLWREVTADERANATPEMWQANRNDQLYFTPRQGETFGTGAADNFEMTYAAPHRGQRGLSLFSFTYDIDLPAGWEVNVLTADYDFGNPTAVDTLASSGSPLAGSVTWSLLDDFGVSQQRLIVQVRNNTGSPVTLGGSTGDEYVKLTGIRVRTASAVTADAIAAHLASYVNGINPGQLPAGTALNVEPSTFDLEDAIYEDAYPADILNSLMDQAVEGERWQWSVWENRRLQFYPRGARSRTWYTDIAGLNVDGSLDSLHNSVYGVYTNGHGETERTVAAEALASQEAYGVIRNARVRARSEAQAVQQRDLMLAEAKEVTARSRVVLAGLYNVEGASFPLWMCRAGDVMIIRNLPPVYSPTIDKIRKFYVTATSYDMESDVLSPTPGLDLPGLDILVGNITPR